MQCVRQTKLTQALAFHSMTVLWVLCRQAGKDLSVSKYQHAELECALEWMEQVLESLLSDYGTIALLEVGISK